MGVNRAMVQILRGGVTGEDGKPIWGGRLPAETQFDLGAVEVIDTSVPENSKDGQRDHRYNLQANIYALDLDVCDQISEEIMADWHGLYGSQNGLNIRGCIYLGNPLRDYIELKEAYLKVVEYQLDLHVVN